MDAYKIADGHAPYFLTFTIVDWVDVFTRKAYRDLFTSALNYYVEHRDLRVYEYVIMSNHAHLILQQPNGELGKTVQDFKKFTAKGILELTQTEPESRRDWMLYRFAYNSVQSSNTRQHQVWIHDSHAIELWSQKFFLQKRDYLRMNPVVAGLVEKPEHWLYSSASDLISHSPLVRLTAYE